MVYGLAWVGRSVIRDLRGEVFGHYLALPARYFDQGSSGVLISRLTYNTEQVAEAVSTAIVIALRDTIAILVLLVMMISYEPTADVADRRGRPRDRVGGGRHESRVAPLQHAHSALDGRRHEAHRAVAARSSRRQGVRRPRARAPAIQRRQYAQLPPARASRRRSGAGRRPDAVRRRARRRRRDVLFVLRSR